MNSVDLYSGSQFMRLDLNARRNLELLETLRDKEKRGSLLWVLDKTKTAMGKRLIRLWIERPLLSPVQILHRQNAVEELAQDGMLRENAAEQLSGIYDLERLMTRIVYGSANARELRSLCAAAGRLPRLKELLSGLKSNLLQQIYRQIDTLEDVRDLIDRSIVDEPPFSIREGGMIRPGYSAELDELKGDMGSSKEYIARIEAQERERTGIPKLKIGYNRVFGYYIEIPNAFRDKAPEEYIRKQTLTNCERFITPELKVLEGRILGAHDKSIQLETHLFDQVRKQVSEQLSRVQATAAAIAQLDIAPFVRFRFRRERIQPPACEPERKNYFEGKPPPRRGASARRRPVRPERRAARPGRKPRAHHHRAEHGGEIDVYAPDRAHRADGADRLFRPGFIRRDRRCRQHLHARRRVGQPVVRPVHLHGGDDGGGGHPENATSRSLLILDEIGRGTSTFDGMSIARAVLEYVADKRLLGAKALFATHYHELTELEKLVKGVKNYNIAVKKRGDDITFLRRIVRGGADDSYGIEVAKLAGVPQKVVTRAKQVLKELENGKPVTTAKRPARDDGETGQLALTPPNESEVMERLKKMDVNTLTPIECMNALFRLSELARK